jgi:serine/threonine protein kinase
MKNVVTGQEYVLGEELGAGGFGVAFKARRRSTDGDSALETCLKLTKDSDSWHGEAFFGRFLNSAPHAIRTLDSFPVIITTGRQRKHGSIVFCIETELIESGTVLKACSKGTLPWPEERVIRQVRLLLRTLDVLHVRSIAHRDITPSNVFIGNRGVLKLGDFGIARMQSQKRGSVADFAAWSYAPPDLGQFWNTADDTYQVGLLALTLLSGKPVTNVEVSRSFINSLTSKGRLRDCLYIATINARSRRYRDAASMHVALGR